MPEKPQSSAAHEEISFLRFTIDYIERRINLLDQKAGLLLAGLGFFAGAGFSLFQLCSAKIPHELLSVGNADGQNYLHFLTGVIVIAPLVFAAFTLMQTIRPTPPFGFRVKSICFKEEPPPKYIMWFGQEPLPSRESLYPMTLEEIRDQLDYTLRGILCLAQRKQHYYRYAVLWSKASILGITLWIIVSFLLCMN